MNIKTSLLAIVFLLGMGTQSLSQASVRPQESEDSVAKIENMDMWLERLEERLYPKAECERNGNRCAHFLEMSAKPSENGSLDLIFRIEAQERSSLPLPSISGGEIEGISVRALKKNGRIIVLAERGMSTIKIQIRPISAELAIDFAEFRPKFVSWAGKGWQMTEQKKSGEAISQVILSKEIQGKGGQAPSESPEGKASSEISDVKPYFSITRIIRAEQKRIWTETRVSRLSDSTKPLETMIDLLPGERPANQRVSEDGKRVVISFASGASSTSYVAEFEPKEEIALQAPNRLDWKETWIAEISPRLFPGFEGLQPVDLTEGGMIWLPSPGEKTRISMGAKALMSGAAVAIDSVMWKTALGEGVMRHSGQITARASTAEKLGIKIPEGWELAGVFVNNEKGRSRKGTDAIEIDVPAGKSQIALSFEENRGPKMVESAPAISFGKDTANMWWGVDSGGRWVLWGGGSGIRPSVLFWGALFVLAVLGWQGQKRISSPWMPKSFGWVIIGGPLLATNPWGIAWLVIFALSLEWKARRPSVAWWNGRQIVIFAAGLASLSVLIEAAYQGLAGYPDMMIRSSVPRFSDELHGAGQEIAMKAYRMGWYSDRSAGNFLDGWLVSAPIWAWRGMMLLWALFMAREIARRLPRAWEVICEGGIWISSKNDGKKEHFWKKGESAKTSDKDSPKQESQEDGTEAKERDSKPGASPWAAAEKTLSDGDG